MRGSKPRLPEDGAGSMPSQVPLLGEMERTVSLIQLAFTNSESLSVFTPRPAGKFVGRDFPDRRFGRRRLQAQRRNLPW